MDEARPPLAPGDVVDERGIVVTAAGRERARRTLAEATARMTPEKWAALRARYGIDAA